jgi:signal transduction histidine kinase
MAQPRPAGPGPGTPATAAIVKDGVREADIIDRLRSLYKKAAPQRESVDVDEIIGEIVPLLRGEANRYAVSIRTDLAADLPRITADRVQLQQVLMNLMLNGIEAMKETGGELTVKTGRSEGCQVLHHKTSRQRHGTGHQPFHR